MDFVPLISTLVGAAIGIGSAMLADRTRWIRDRRERIELAQQQLRADFIAAVAHSADIIWNVAHQDQPPTEDGNRRVYEAFREADLYTWRYRIALSSPPEIVAGCESLLDALRHYREAVAAGERPGSTQYREARGGYFNAVAETINVLRASKGPLPFSIRQSVRRAGSSASDPAGR